MQYLHWNQSNEKQFASKAKDKLNNFLLFTRNRFTEKNKLSGLDMNLETDMHSLKR